MAILTWPADLPQRVLVEGFSITFANGSVAQRMDSGYSKTRRRGRGPKQVTAMQDGNVNFVTRFERWWEEGTNFGTYSFWFPDAINNGTPLTDEDGVPITDESGHPITVVASWLAKFVGEPSKPVLVGPTWFKIGFVLDIFPA